MVAGKRMEDIKRMEEPTTEICDKRGSPLIPKAGVQVREFLFLLELQQAEAGDRKLRGREEGREGGGEEDHLAAEVSYDGEGADRGCD